MYEGRRGNRKNLKNVLSPEGGDWTLSSFNRQIQTRLDAIRFTIYHIALIAGIISPVLIVIADIIGVITGNAYNPLTNSISDLGLGSTGWLQSAVFILFGITTISLAAELYNELHDTHESRLGLIMMTALGAGFIFMGLFHNDPAGAPRTLHDMIHHFSALLEGGLFPVTCFFFADMFKTKINWRILTRYSVIAGILGCFLSLTWLVFQNEWFGLSERLIILNGLIWFEVLAIHLRRVSKSPHIIRRRHG
jgi:hypothetical membrane protein